MTKPKREMHGGKGTSEYRSWMQMRSRCNSPTNPGFHRYGGRGITVCSRWNSFKNFRADMGAKPTPKHSLDRIDNDGPYSPENCRWATDTEQMNNRSNCLRFEFNGKIQTLSEWARELNRDYFAIRARIRLGWDIERALTTPTQPYKPQNSKKQLLESETAK